MIKKAIAIAMTLIIMMSFVPNIGIASKGLVPFGDVTEDGKLNTADAALILSWAAGYVEFTDSQLNIADANSDGEVNTADAVYVLNVIVGNKEPNYFEKSIYTVTYAPGANSSAAVPPSADVKAGTTYTISTVSYNSQFLGWLSSYDSKVYAPGSSFVMPEKDVVLTGCWEGIETPEPTPPASDPQDVEIKYYDSLNDLNVSTETIKNISVVNSDVLNVPEGFKLENESLSIAAAPSVTVNVYPYETKDDGIFRLIKNITGFENLRKNLAVNYSLAADIDLMAKNFVPFGWTNTSVNSQQIEFTGKFDGNGHRIDDLYIDYHGASSSQVYKNAALFAINKGTIRNIVIYTNMPSSSSDYYYGIFSDRNVGSVCGTNYGKISGCRVYGYIGSLDMYASSGGKVGGICGTNTEYGVVEKSSFEGAIDGFYWVGGLIGMNYGTLTQSYFSGGLNATTSDNLISTYKISYVGGLCGGAQESTITDCYAVCTSYYCAYTALGGMIGWYDKGVIKNVYIVDTQLYYASSGQADYTVGYLPNGVDSYPSEQSGLCLFNSTDGGGWVDGFSTDVWDMNGELWSTMPDLIYCRRGSAWFNAFTL